VIALTNFSGDPLDAPWTSDFMPNNARIENGNLVLTLKKNDAVNKFGNRPGFGATVSSTRYVRKKHIETFFFLPGYSSTRLMRKYVF